MYICEANEWKPIMKCFSVGASIVYVLFFSCCILLWFLCTYVVVCLKNVIQKKKKQKKWKQCLDQRLVFSLSNELYKFFDCLSHELQNLNSCKIKCIYIGNFGHAFNLLTISPLENSILQLAATMAYGKNFFLEFHKDQF